MWRSVLLRSRPLLVPVARRTYCTPFSVKIDPNDFYTTSGTYSESGKKISTDIVGLEVVENSSEVLAEMCREVLGQVSQGIPEDAEYRKNVEASFTFRLKCAEQFSDPRELELAVRTGQTEQLIQQARDELLLIKEMRKWKPWEVPAEEETENNERADMYRERLRDRNCDFTEVFADRTSSRSTFDSGVETKVQQ